MIKARVALECETDMLYYNSNAYKIVPASGPYSCHGCSLVAECAHAATHEAEFRPRQICADFEDRGSCIIFKLRPWLA